VNRIFFEHLGENAVGAAAYAAVGALGSAGAKTIGDVPWYGVLSTAVIAGLVAVLTGVASLRQGNGTASFVPGVVARQTNDGDGPRP
jgi:ABC-type branched-subunit amino acid transport system permease subunit